MGKVFSADGSINLDADFYAPYNWYDLADDVAAVMDCHKIAKASIIGFSTGGVIAQFAMCRLKDRLHSAVICSSSCELLPSEAPFENPALQELMAAAAAVSPESTKEERVKGLLPSQMAMWEVEEGDAWQAILTKAIEDDYDKGWMDIYGGMNPFSTLAWASTAKSHEQHLLMLEENVVPCLIVAGKKDPLVPYKQSEMLAAKTGRATMESHEHGHILGPASSRSVLLDTIADFIKKQSMPWDGWRSVACLGLLFAPWSHIHLRRGDWNIDNWWSKITRCTAHFIPRYSLCSLRCAMSQAGTPTKSIRRLHFLEKKRMLRISRTNLVMWM